MEDEKSCTIIKSVPSKPLVKRPVTNYLRNNSENNSTNYSKGLRHKLYVRILPTTVHLIWNLAINLAVRLRKYGCG